MNNQELPPWGTILILVVVVPIGMALGHSLIEWAKRRANRHRHQWLEYEGSGPRDRLRRCETCGVTQQFWDDCTTIAQGWKDVDPRYLP